MCEVWGSQKPVNEMSAQQEQKSERIHESQGNKATLLYLS